MPVARFCPAKAPSAVVAAAADRITGGNAYSGIVITRAVLKRAITVCRIARAACIVVERKAAIAVLSVPFVLFASALSPTATFSEPVVLSFSAKSPTAVLSFPLLLDIKACSPTPVLAVPAVLK